MIIGWEIFIDIVKRLRVILFLISESKIHPNDSGYFTASLDVVKECESIKEYTFQDI